MKKTVPSKKPLVSVVMATYNRADYLQRSITSFLKQTFQTAELIIVDDGSTDNTSEIVAFFLQQNGLIRYLPKSHRGAPAAKNSGIQTALGEYLAFLDSDDEYEADYLKKRMQFLKVHTEVDLLESDAKIIGDPFVKDKDNPKRKIPIADCHIGATFFGKTEIFRALGGFPENLTYSEDGVFWEKAEKIYCCRKVKMGGYIYHRDTPDSICNLI